MKIMDTYGKQLSIIADMLKNAGINSSVRGEGKGRYVYAEHGDRAVEAYCGDASLLVEFFEESEEYSVDRSQHDTPEQAAQRAVDWLLRKITDKGPFMTYSTDGRLVYYANEEALNDALGHDYSGGGDWKSDDRVINSSGRTYNIVYNKEDHFYHIEYAGEVWDYRKVLHLAIEACKAVKCDPQALIHKVEAENDTNKIRTIMEHIRDLPDGPPLFVTLQWCFIAVLVALFVLFVYGVYRLISWLI
jgi:hypothetical protein